MGFNSLDFLFFLVIFLPLWEIVKRNVRAIWILLTLASFIFYGWWDWRFLFLLIFSGALDYYFAVKMYHGNRRKIYLWLSLCSNLLLLCTFKYSLFFAENIDYVLNNYFDIEFSFKSLIPPFALILPVGISFYTFQSLSYVIDVHKGKLKPAENIFHFFSYLSMFPQLVAGPIVRATTLIPQLAKIPKVSDLQKQQALWLIAVGYFKKLVIADNIAPLVTAAFVDPSAHQSGLYWWAIMVGFSIQIYCDFSGYSSIAIGLGKYLGYEFDKNFNLPYFAVGVQDFWRRWHMSLSTWFRDYLYIPLGGNRTESRLKNHINHWVTMILSGLWHGAGWSYILWGASHALFISLEKLTLWPSRIKYSFVTNIIGALVTYIMIVTTWVLFRADNINDALWIISSMYSIKSLFLYGGIYTKGLGKLILPIVAMLIGNIITIYTIKEKRVNGATQYLAVSMSYRIVLLVSTIIVLITSVYFRGSGSEFIYFQF